MAEIVQEFLEHGVNAIVFNIIFTQAMDSFFCTSAKYAELCGEYLEVMLNYLLNPNCQIFDFAITNTIVSILTKHKMRNTCSAGMGNLTINTEGDILKCYLSDDPAYFREHSLDFNSSKKIEVNLPENCAGCEIFGLCSGWCAEINQGKVVESKCLYIRQLVHTVLARMYEVMQDRAQLGTLLANIKRFKEAME
ncbi:MAG: hypothetical protein Q4E09_03865 [Eubacteriales bacterium]|nr:hypothetical protein [Eubacteriales bacterium]